MGLISDFFKKREPLLSEENKQELREIRRKAYMEEAKKHVEEKAKLEARKDLGIKKKKEEF